MTGATIAIRPAAAGDVAAVDALLRDSFPAPDEAELVQRLCIDGDMVLMLVAAEEATGSLRWSRDGCRLAEICRGVMVLARS